MMKKIFNDEYSINKEKGDNNKKRIEVINN